ncbi:c-type cytochrome [Aneurinibacillus terranovensis]|uniref:c-type cytochrome n=1 Tax=Aneurinibacillus terranovensis TaxID=278991 RepID=UPI000429C35A|nr:cytochrome c [Aneurinibacillus terranovensis]
MKKWIIYISSLLLTLALAAGCGTANKNAQQGNTTGGAGGGTTGGTSGANKGTAGGNTAGGTTAAANAQKMYQAHCIVCHGQNLEGGVGPALAKIGSQLSRDQIRNRIINGGGGMPAHLVSDADAKVLADWLVTKK